MIAAVRVRAAGCARSCRNGVGASLSVRTLWSADTPTIWNSGPSQPRVRKVLPIALSPGQYRRAIVSFTIATRGVSGRSSSVNARPSTIATPIVLKYSGETRRHLDRVAVLAGLMPPRHPDLPAVGVHRHRHARRERRRLDAGNRAHPLERLRRRNCSLRIRRVAQHAGVGGDDREPVDRRSRRWCAAPR